MRINRMRRTVLASGPQFAPTGHWSSRNLHATCCKFALLALSVVSLWTCGVCTAHKCDLLCYSCKLKSFSVSRIDFSSSFASAIISAVCVAMNSGTG